jgi:hypothetical protein
MHVAERTDEGSAALDKVDIPAEEPQRPSSTDSELESPAKTPSSLGTPRIEEVPMLVGAEPEPGLSGH